MKTILFFKFSHATNEVHFSVISIISTILNPFSGSSSYYDQPFLSSLSPSSILPLAPATYLQRNVFATIKPKIFKPCAPGIPLAEADSSPGLVPYFTTFIWYCKARLRPKKAAACSIASYQTSTSFEYIFTPLSKVFVSFITFLAKLMNLCHPDQTKNDISR